MCVQHFFFYEFLKSYIVELGRSTRNFGLLNSFYLRFVKALGLLLECVRLQKVNNADVVYLRVIVSPEFISGEPVESVLTLEAVGELLDFK
jgi:hypothetical protein